MKTLATLTNTVSEGLQTASWASQQWVADHEKHLNILTTTITITIGITLVSTAYTYQQKAGPARTQPNIEMVSSVGTYVPATCAEASDMITQTTLPVKYLQTEINAAKTLCAPSRYEKIIAYKELQAAAK